jgi:hypothetical protein
MACCAQNTPGAGLVPADSCKRVNYTLGMLLGVDDFVQESVYNGSRRRELAREVLGYGTVHGLQVLAEADGDKGPRLRVTPGMAWLPSGTPVCVDSDQCANLNDWLAAHEAEVAAALAGAMLSPPRLTLYLVLSHLQCLTDNVPIPGEPCRSDEDLMQPSRIADSFRLALRLAPVTQREEDGLRDFVEWLVGQPLVSGSPPLDEAAFMDQLREAAHDWLMPGSPPLSSPSWPPDYMSGEAPPGTDEAMFRLALRLWTTELRPLWMARADCGCDAPPIAPVDDVVLLAQLEVDLVPTEAGGGWRVSDIGAGVTIDESRRPILLSLRMVQELVLRQQGTDPGNMVVPETAFGLLPEAGSALAYARADHTHGSPALPELAGDVTGPLDATLVERLLGVPLALGSPLADGQVLTFEGGLWVAGEVSAVLPDLGGDVAGAPAATVVTQLQGRPLNVPGPAEGQVLRFSGGTWIAADLPAAPPAPEDRFVGRGTPAPYEIVAAGTVELELHNREPVVRVLPPPSAYGGLAVRGVRQFDAGIRAMEIACTVAVTKPDALPNYIVKLTPAWIERTKFGFQLYLLGDIDSTGADIVAFRILLRAEEQIVDGDFFFRFQIEVSRFGELSDA